MIWKNEYDFDVITTDKGWLKLEDIRVIENTEASNELQNINNGRLI